ncbi:hypothetical protein NEMIN01_1656 [Nematocida minor]|uniref:uncharacterized protein n=1 Tax=Nematocida minor TaxID=1912983 RepID=UPI00221E3BF6|nr:uncharacterized protein NEMIN01_1656 [Nematocida minor]KAI5191765.1 hypothetical protein NEMIN01_1656 [Nematocida minor]
MKLHRYTLCFLVLAVHTLCMKDDISSDAEVFGLEKPTSARLDNSRGHEAEKDKEKKDVENIDTAKTESNSQNSLKKTKTDQKEKTNKPCKSIHNKELDKSDEFKFDSNEKEEKDSSDSLELGKKKKHKHTRKENKKDSGSDIFDHDREFLSSDISNSVFKKDTDNELSNHIEASSTHGITVHSKDHLHGSSPEIRTKEETEETTVVQKVAKSIKHVFSSGLNMVKGFFHAKTEDEKKHEKALHSSEQNCLEIGKNKHLHSSRSEQNVLHRPKEKQKGMKSESIFGYGDIGNDPNTTMTGTVRSSQTSQNTEQTLVNGKLVTKGHANSSMVSGRLSKKRNESPIYTEEVTTSSKVLGSTTQNHMFTIDRKPVQIKKQNIIDFYRTPDRPYTISESNEYITLISTTSEDVLPSNCQCKAITLKDSHMQLKIRKIDSESEYIKTVLSKKNAVFMVLMIDGSFMNIKVNLKDIPLYDLRK